MVEHKRKLWFYLWVNLFSEKGETEGLESPLKVNFERDLKFFQSIQDLERHYTKYGIKNSWNESFAFFIQSLDQEMLETLLSQCPDEIVHRSYHELLSYKGVTAFELAALSCRSDNESDSKEETTDLDTDLVKEARKIDCFFDRDDPDMLCSAHGKHCPLIIPPELSRDGITLQPGPIEIDWEELQKNHGSIINNLNVPFDLKYFSNKPSPPISVGFLEDTERFSQWGPLPQPQNLPIKMPFSNYRLPEELVQFEEAVQKIANYWQALNPKYGDYYYCYFSVAQSIVPTNCFQRRGHLHSDGFQSYWIKPKLFSDFSFIVSDKASTECFLQSFDVSQLEPSKHNYYKYFAKHLHVKPLRLRKPYEILLMDSYTLHKAIRNETPVPFRRTFLRFMYSVIRWQRCGNAHNPMFDYRWPTIKRTLLSKLI